jgi:glyoxylase-like metal-dependent hydrolase (beta-lactamase superfamily II)
MFVHRIVNPHRFSNTYIVELSDDITVLIDLGNVDTNEVISYLNEKGKNLSHVILTHEHADHCYGLDTLYEQIQFKLISSPACLKNIRNKKQNFSYYLEDIDTFEVALQEVYDVTDGERMKIGGKEFLFIHTPGHSPGGMCIFLDDFVFTGDTILNGIKTPLSFPHSDKRVYKDSLIKLEALLKKGTKIFPGHGSPFFFDENLIKQYL